MRSWISISDSEYGRLAETVACWWLRMRGSAIVDRNVRVLGREVDIVARRGRTLVICEVKARRGGRRGQAEEMVGERQTRRLLQAAEVLLAADPRARTARVDVVAVNGLRPRHIRAALQHP
ncbi:MAG TPA: YraN family protein [Gaiellales bacterium]|jgi:putative endonuclease